MTLDEARKELADYAADEFPGIWDQSYLQQCICVVLAALPTRDDRPPVHVFGCSQDGEPKSGPCSECDRAAAMFP